MNTRTRLAVLVAASATVIGAINLGAGQAPAAAATRRSAAVKHTSASAVGVVRVTTTSTTRPRHTIVPITMVKPTIPCWYLPNQDCVSYEEYLEYLADKAAGL